MAQQKELAAARRLERLRRQIDLWRTSREKQEPMPARLWKEAGALALELGVNPVKDALGVNYRSLQKHMEDERVALGSRAEDGAGRFVELAGPQVMVGPEVELCDAKGIRLTVRFGVGSALDLVELVKAFRGDSV